MNTSRIKTLTFGALALVAAACSGGGGVAATVNGTPITVEEVERLRPSGGAIPAETFRQDLQQVIIVTAVFDAAETQYGITVSDEEAEQRYEQLRDQAAAQAGGDYEAFLEQQRTTDARVRAVARQQVLAEALQARFTDDAEPIPEEEVKAYYDENTNQFTTACVSHILLETRERALEVKARLDAGEDFAEVAKETSTEPAAAQSGGDLGCQPLSTYVDEFSQGVLDAQIGQVTDPVETQFGFHLILVESLDTQSFEESADQIRTDLAPQRLQQALNDWVIDTLREAEVEVDPEYGEWVTDPEPALVAPSSEQTTTTRAG